MSQVSVSIGCNIAMEKVRRYYTIEACAADSLSKANFSKFRKEMPESNHSPATIPKELLLWIDHPVEDRFLGQRLLREMSTQVNVLGYN